MFVWRVTKNWQRNLNRVCGWTRQHRNPCTHMRERWMQMGKSSTISQNRPSFSGFLGTAFRTSVSKAKHLPHQTNCNYFPVVCKEVCVVAWNQLSSFCNVCLACFVCCQNNNFQCWITVARWYHVDIYSFVVTPKYAVRISEFSFGWYSAAPDGIFVVSFSLNGSLWPKTLFHRSSKMIRRLLKHTDFQVILNSQSLVPMMSKFVCLTDKKISG